MHLYCQKTSFRIQILIFMLHNSTKGQFPCAYFRRVTNHNINGWMTGIRDMINLKVEQTPDSIPVVFSHHFIEVPKYTIPRLATPFHPRLKQTKNKAKQCRFFCHVIQIRTRFFTLRWTFTKNKASLWGLTFEEYG